MKKNLGFILFIALAILALYLSKINYEDYGLKKSISACVLGQKRTSDSFNLEKAKKFCEKEIIRRKEE